MQPENVHSQVGCNLPPRGSLYSCPEKGEVEVKVENAGPLAFPSQARGRDCPDEADYDGRNRSAGVAVVYTEGNLSAAVVSLRYNLLPGLVKKRKVRGSSLKKERRIPKHWPNLILSGPDQHVALQCKLNRGSVRTCKLMCLSPPVRLVDDDLDYSRNVLVDAKETKTELIVESPKAALYVIVYLNVIPVLKYLCCS